MPLLVFSTTGFRRAFLWKAHDGDFVCFVATKGKNTAGDDKGRLLGIATVSSVMINAEGLLLKLGDDRKRNPVNYENGHYKWPFGIQGCSVL
jgi:hypothetical protein